jgi:alkanesulfonate monooxygenase SsuD/methylene tetrahydromethanopterin reductase-like flavin-dependent oxidoreductase (luciferase family)
MRFGVFYELQMPKPWDAESERRIVHEALAQVELADRLGFDYAWCVEHHFLEEYSHCSAPEVFLAAAAARTRRIRLGHGIRQVIPNYNHPARTAEGLGMLDLVSDGRLDFGIGEGATRLELGGFKISAKEKRTMALEAAEQIANMMVLEPYPGFDGRWFTMPARNVIPKPLQKPHPPMWMACTNRDTIRVAARNGLGALAFAFVDPDEARTWSGIYYDIIKSEECVPLGHSVNANLAMVSAFSIHEDRAEAIRRGQEGFEFFFFAVNALVAQDARPGRSRLWESFTRARGDRTAELVARAQDAGYRGAGIGTPDDMRTHVREFQAAGVDQVIFLQQAGHNRHGDIVAALELFARTVAPEFQRVAAEREARKREDLAPWIARALERKQWMRPLADDAIPIVGASRAKAEVNQAAPDRR